MGRRQYERARESASAVTAVLCDKPPGSSLHPIQGSNGIVVGAPGDLTPHNVDHDARITGRKEF